MSELVAFPGTISVDATHPRAAAAAEAARQVLAGETMVPLSAVKAILERQCAAFRDFSKEPTMKDWFDHTNQMLFDLGKLLVACEKQAAPPAEAKP